ncbi:DUF411 domain-containing protein [Halomonas halocynthiae]|uniref:DUF411 domain-containing protein n=1 Tax=Halomonas halocynthiae TaxID=176290 RepID=UPI000489E8AA|nr:DUF411 domain-containing protein [Halomonas halocynthiae]
MKRTIAPLVSASLLLATGFAHAESLNAQLYKDPNCGCCETYARLMEEHGYHVKSIDVANLGRVKQQAGIPYGEGACHTIELGGYIIEGHVPFAAIDRLLEERPDIDGIGLAGMPIGTPGMPGPKTEDWVVKAFNDGNTTPWMTF